MVKLVRNILLCVAAGLVCVIMVVQPVSAAYTSYYSGSSMPYEAKWSGSYKSYGGEISVTPLVYGRICTYKWNGPVQCSTKQTWSNRLSIWPSASTHNFCYFYEGGWSVNSPISSGCYKKTSW